MLKKIIVLMVLMLIPFGVADTLKSCLDTNTLNVTKDKSLIIDGNITTFQVMEEIYCPYGCINNECISTKSGMPIEIYVFLFLLSFGLFVLSFLKEPKGVFVLISMMLFFFLAFTSNNIERNVCDWNGKSWNCYKNSIPETSLVALNSGFGLVSLIYMIFYAISSFRSKGD